MEAYVGESRFVLCLRLTECYGWHKSPQESALSSTDLCDNGVPMAIPMGKSVAHITRGNSAPARTSGTQADVPCSLRSRACLLPAFLRVGRIVQRTMTRETHGGTLPPLGGRDPARLVARDDVVRWGELHVVTAVFCTAERSRL